MDNNTVRQFAQALQMYNKIPWTEDPSGLQSMELQKIRHD